MTTKNFGNMRILLKITSFLIIINGILSYKTKNLFKVNDLPGLSNISLDEQPNMFAGNMPAWNDSEVFFWLFQKKSDVNDRLIIWLNGKPGCSSLEGALMDIGPFKLGLNGRMERNDGGWLEAADLLFVDLFQGSGLSQDTGNYYTNILEPGRSFLTFYQNFLTTFPSYKDKKVYLAGEHYSGQLIPRVAFYIIQNNNNRTQIGVLHLLLTFPGMKLLSNEKGFSFVTPEKDDSLVLKANITLSGLLIGNGYLDPDRQSLSYVDYALSHNLINETHQNFSKLHLAYSACLKVIAGNVANSGPDVFSNPICTNTIMQLLLDATVTYDSTNKSTCYNVHDYSLRSPYPYCGLEWPSESSVIANYLSNTAVLKLLNLGSYTKYSLCNNQVPRHLLNYNVSSFSALFDRLIFYLPIVLYNGDKSIFCNHESIENFTQNLTWGGQQGWTKSYKEFAIDGKVIGKIKTDRGLTLININNSSLRVLYNEPLQSRAIIKYLLNDFNSNVTTVQTSFSEKSLSFQSMATAFTVTLVIGIASSVAIICYLKYIYISDFLDIKVGKI